MTPTPDIIKKLEAIVALGTKPRERMGLREAAERASELDSALRNSIPTLKEAVKVIERQKKLEDALADCVMVMEDVNFGDDVDSAYRKCFDSALHVARALSPKPDTILSREGEG